MSDQIPAYEGATCIDAKNIKINRRPNAEVKLNSLQGQLNLLVKKRAREGKLGEHIHCALPGAQPTEKLKVVGTYIDADRILQASSPYALAKQMSHLDFCRAALVTVFLDRSIEGDHLPAIRSLDEWKEVLFTDYYCEILNIDLSMVACDDHLIGLYFTICVSLGPGILPIGIAFQVTNAPQRGTKKGPVNLPHNFQPQLKCSRYCFYDVGLL